LNVDSDPSGELGGYRISDLALDLIACASEAVPSREALQRCGFP
jgi:hypothetical protein